MKQKIYILILLLGFFSCTSNIEPKNKKLLGFKYSFLAELGDEKYDLLETKLGKSNIEIQYINDIIYVSYYERLNACAKYSGDIQIKADTIHLNVYPISDEVCTSTAIYKVTFLLDNPDTKKKVILK